MDDLLDRDDRSAPAAPSPGGGPARARPHGLNRAALDRIRPAVPGLTGLAAGLFVLAVALLYCVSGGMLWLAGFNYEGLTGSPLTKIHPGTYLVVMLFGWVALRGGNPFGLMAEMAQRRPACLLMLIAMVVMFLQIVIRKGPGMAGTIDTFMLPPFVVMLFLKSSERTRSWLEIVLHLSMLANAGLGLVEFVTKHLYFPYRFDGEFFAMDTRSSSLQGHPLGNATITAVYILALMNGGSTLSSPQRLMMIVVQMMAMVAFGGRVALVTVLVLGGGYCVVLTHRVLRSNRVPVLGAAVAVMALTFVPIIVVGLYTGGFFDALLTRFETDGGSANARVEMLNLLSAIRVRDLIVGPDQVLVDSLRRQNGLELGIENPIVRMVLYQGAVVTGLIMLSVGLFFFELVRWSRAGLALPLFAFVVIINTFESLGGKTTMLAKFGLMMLVFYRPVVTDGRAPSGVRPVPGSTTRWPVPRAGAARGARAAGAAPR